ncbi:MAG: HD domain-containing protein, partial [Magnetococcales bacterium]|nr:HD domain-containing protein [Magnetococcales bacterium]
TLEGIPIGRLVWHTPLEQTELIEQWARHLVTVCQGLMEVEHARRAVTSEALESFREIALLERASSVLNRSLRPREVGDALLGELTSRARTIRWGAVFLYNVDPGNYSLLNIFGEDAEPLFLAFADTPLFKGYVEGQITGILNDTRSHPLHTGGETLFRAILGLPLEAHNERVAILFLAADHVDAFVSADLKRTTALTSMAATALRNAQMFEAETQMFRAFISMMASAIDAKSPYTAGHCRRVPEIARMLTRAACESTDPPFQDFSFSEDDWETLEIATYLHDCGKVVTPEWVVDKPTKLSTNFDRIDMVELRILLMMAQEELAILKGQTGVAEVAQQKPFMDDLKFLKECNLGKEFISAENEARLRTLATFTWRDAKGEEQPLLTAEELTNLLIRRGTLNAQERQIIEDHVVHTINMLNSIPFPPRLRNVVEYAGGHHECMNGKGYPNRLTDTMLSLPARIVAIADIFEALTAPDRPYRLPYMLSKALDIMFRMSKEGHIDPELFGLFLRSGIYQRYADHYLKPSQIDAVDIRPYLLTPLD